MPCATVAQGRAAKDTDTFRADDTGRANINTVHPCSLEPWQSRHQVDSTSIITNSHPPSCLFDSFFLLHHLVSLSSFFALLFLNPVTRPQSAQNTPEDLATWPEVVNHPQLANVLTSISPSSHLDDNTRITTGGPLSALLTEHLCTSRPLL